MTRHAVVGRQANERDLEGSKHKASRRSRKDADVPRADLALLQTKAGNQAVADLLAAGKPMEPRVRAEMETRFGVDFRDVRIHDDRSGDQASVALGADAFTEGRDVAFRDGRYSPGTRNGKRLLAHELAHVVQQRRGGAKPDAERSTLEGHAESAASAVVGTTTAVSVGGASAPGVMRDRGDDLDDEKDRKRDQQAQRERDKAKDKKRAQERSDAGKSHGKRGSDEAESKVRKLEKQVQAPGANQRSQRRKEKTLKKVERLLPATSGSQLEKNKRKGDFDEAQRTSGKAQAQGQYVAGGPKVPGQQLTDEHGRVASHARPDYSVYKRRADGSLERVHVNLKSHQIDQMTESEARQAAREILYQAVGNKRHLPKGEKLVIDFAHVPNKAVQEAIKNELFREGAHTPVDEVHFGTIAHREEDYQPQGGRQPLDVDAKSRQRRIAAEKKATAKQAASSQKVPTGKTTGTKGTATIKATADPPKSKKAAGDKQTGANTAAPPGAAAKTTVAPPAAPASKKPEGATAQKEKTRTAPATKSAKAKSTAAAKSDDKPTTTKAAPATKRAKPQGKGTAASSPAKKSSKTSAATTRPATKTAAGTSPEPSKARAGAGSKTAAGHDLALTQPKTAGSIRTDKAPTPPHTAAVKGTSSAKLAQPTAKVAGPPTSAPHAPPQTEHPHPSPAATSHAPTALQPHPPKPAAAAVPHAPTTSLESHPTAPAAHPSATHLATPQLHLEPHIAPSSLHGAAVSTHAAAGGEPHLGTPHVPVPHTNMPHVTAPNVAPSAASHQMPLEWHEGAMSFGGAMFQTFAVPYINREFLQTEEWKKSVADEARDLTNQKLREKSPEIAQLIDDNAAHIKRAQAEGRDVSVIVTMRQSWQDTTDPDTGFSHGDVMTNVDVVDVRLKFEDEPYEKYEPHENWLGHGVRWVLGTTFHYPRSETPLAGTDQDVQQRRLSHKVIDAQLYPQYGTGAPFEYLILQRLEGGRSLDDLREYVAYRTALAEKIPGAGPGAEASAYCYGLQQLLDGSMADFIAAAKAKGLSLDNLKGFALYRSRTAVAKDDPDAQQVADYWAEVARLISASR